MHGEEKRGGVLHRCRTHSTSHVSRENGTTCTRNSQCQECLVCLGVPDVVFLLPYAFVDCRPPRTKHSTRAPGSATPSLVPPWQLACLLLWRHPHRFCGRWRGRWGLRKAHRRPALVSPASHPLPPQPFFVLPRAPRREEPKQRAAAALGAAAFHSIAERKAGQSAAQHWRLRSGLRHAPSRAPPDQAAPGWG